jgi:hypothetical protein
MRIHKLFERLTMSKLAHQVDVDKDAEGGQEWHQRHPEAQLLRGGRLQAQRGDAEDQPRHDGGDDGDYDDAARDEVLESILVYGLGENLREKK